MVRARQDLESFHLRLPSDMLAKMREISEGDESMTHFVRNAIRKEITRRERRER